MKFHSVPRCTAATDYVGMNRAEAIRLAGEYLHSGGFLAELDRRVGWPTESQNPDRRGVLRGYLEQELLPAFSELGFSCELIELPTGKSPFLLAEYCENLQGRPF
jgi:hypothetical protein